jgi:hypothetical protein
VRACHPVSLLTLSGGSRCSSLHTCVWQVSLGPVDTISDGSGLREGVQALPPSVASLRLRPAIKATRGTGEVGGSGGAAAWQLRQRSSYGDEDEDVHSFQWDAACALGLCTAFDQPGLLCSLGGEVRLYATPPADPEALGAYLGQCAELGGRMRGSLLSLEVDDTAAAVVGMADGGGGGGFLGRVLGAVLPGAAPRLKQLRVMMASAYPTGYSRHLVAPGLAFPLLEGLELHTYGDGDRTMAGVDVAALCRLAAPQLERIALLAPLHGQNWESGVSLIHGPTGQPCAEVAVTALAACWPRLDGRTTTIRVGCSPGDAAAPTVAQVLQAVAGEGAAEHVCVEWVLVRPGHLTSRGRPVRVGAQCSGLSPSRFVPGRAWICWAGWGSWAGLIVRQRCIGISVVCRQKTGGAGGQTGLPGHDGDGSTRIG